MKKLLPIALLLVASATQAQKITSGSAFLNKQYKGHRAIATNKSGQKTTNTYWRISATSTYSSLGMGLMLSDSTYYKYSNARGSSLNLNQQDLEFDNYGFEGTIDCDTEVVYQENGSGLELSERYINSYTTSNIRSEIIEQYPGSGGNFENDSKYIAIRDGSNRIIKQYTLYWSGVNWDTAQIENITYNGAGNMVLDSMYNISGGNTSPFQKSSYSYDGNGNLTGLLNQIWNMGTWDTTFQELYTWVNNKPAVTVTRYKVNNIMQNAYWDSTGYDNNDNYVYNLTKEWNANNSTWENSSLEVRTINNNQPTTAVYSEWDGSAWETVYGADFSYNSNGDVTKIAVFEYVNGVKQSNPEAEVNIYYEHYFNVGIDNLTKNTELKVYPNPAHDLLNVVVKNNSTSTVRLTNMMGQMVYTAEVTGGQIAIPVSNIVAGNYVLSVGEARQLVTIQ